MKRLLLLCSSLLLLGAAPQGDSLARIMADVWQHELETDPILRLKQGLPVETLADLSPEGERKEIAYKRSILERMARIDPASLPHQDDLTLQVLRWSLEQDVRLGDHLDLHFLITPNSFPLRLTNDVFSRHPLRYSVGMPGQALAYKMGSLKMRELRRRAEQELGPRFDLRRFHEALIGNGSLPLGVLEKHIGWWIAQEKAR